MGCGHGVLVSLLAARLTSGEVVGIDRSRTMIATATRRNRTVLDAGRARLQAATLVEADLPDAAFDVVVSFNVRVFWTPPAQEWDVVDRVLAPRGRVLVAFSLMAPETLDPVTDAVRELAGRRGFAVIAVHRAATTPFESVALELRRT